jgi:hypothetical protein
MRPEAFVARGEPTIEAFRGNVNGLHAGGVLQVNVAVNLVAQPRNGFDVKHGFLQVDIS